MSRPGSRRRRWGTRRGGSPRLSTSRRYRLLNGVVDQLQVDLLGSVPEAGTQLEDTGVARVAVVELGGHVLEELADDLLVLQDLYRLPASSQVVLLGRIYEPVHDAAQLLGLRRGGLYAAVLDKLAGHRAEQSFPVLGVPAQFAAPLSVPHCPRSLKCSRTRGAWSGSRPRSSSRGCGCS